MRDFSSIWLLYPVWENYYSLFSWVVALLYLMAAILLAGSLGGRYQTALTVFKCPLALFVVGMAGKSLFILFYGSTVDAMDLFLSSGAAIMALVMAICGGPFGQGLRDPSLSDSARESATSQLSRQKG